MNRDKINKLAKLKLAKVLLLCSSVLVMCTGCSYNKSGFDSIIAPYTKEETLTNTYEFSGDKLIINSECSELDISVGETNQVQVIMEKKVGGRDEDAVNEEMKYIKNTYDNGVLNIISHETDDIVNSKDINTTIKVPEGTKILEIYNDVGDLTIKGDYENIVLDVKVGNLSFDGEAKKCRANIDVGNIKMDLKKAEKEYSLNLNTRVGDININVPTGSRINLISDCKGEISVSKGVTIYPDGMFVEANTNVGEIKIDNK